MLSAINTKSSSIDTRSWLVDLVFITLFLGIFYAIWIGSHALFTPDEGRYSEVAREMIATGDYITPRLNGVAFLDKPILYYWLQASAIKLFGLKEWALRFWPALIGVLGCLATYSAGRMLFSRRTGILSALILATSPLYYGAAHYANLDLEVSVLVSISLLSFICGISSESRRQQTTLLITAYIFAGLAFLTKGLLGLFFPAMIIGAWILLLNRWNTLKKMHLLTGLAIFVAISLPWYILVQKANPQFFQFFFIDQQVSRFLTKGDFNNKTAGWFYIPIVLIGTFPWSVFAFQAIVQKIKLVWKNRQTHSAELFLLLWLFLVFIFFSIPKSKTVGYILPIFPALSLLIGSYIDRACNQLSTNHLRSGLILFLILSPFIIVAAVVSPFIKQFDISPSLIPHLHITALIFLLSSLTIAYQLINKKDVLQKFATLLITAMASLLVVIASTQVINQKTIKPLALQIKPILQDNDEIVTYYKYYQDLPIYLERRITIVADWKAKDIAQNDNWLRELWYGMPFQDTSKWLIDDENFWNKWNSNNRLFVMMNTNYFDEFNAKARKKIYKISQLNNVILISNQDVKI